MINLVPLKAIIRLTQGGTTTYGVLKDIVETDRFSAIGQPRTPVWSISIYVPITDEDTPGTAEKTISGYYERDEWEILQGAI